MKQPKKLLWLIPILLVIILGAGLYWALTPLGPDDEALQALESNEAVTVEQNPWNIFTPSEEQTQAGLIFYPGGRVDPRSYAPLAHEIAEEGYLVVIAPMPLNLAVLGVSEASEIMDAFLDIDSWVIGGHSLGGAMAARYALENEEKVDGLALLAAYPPEGDDLSAFNMAVTSISASEDGLASRAEIEASKRLLPPDSTFVVIDGGNHAQFGSYGPQNGDNPATISPSEQRALTVSALLDLLRSAEG